MTYKELADEILALVSKQQNCDLTVHLADSDEFLPAKFMVVGDSEGVLDENHPVFTIDW